MKSALFVDFDNVYSGLRRLDLAYAEAFASDPLRWMNWLTGQLPLPADADEGGKRRILVRRCYLNPVMYQRFRFGFSRAGFEIVDCPPMTTAGKTSTDIHMVLDIVDVLLSPTRYDEFIVFSADADFTPVLRKLRRDDRRTTMFAAGATSASYDASADLIINPEAFISEALGFTDEEPLAEKTTDFDGLLAQAEAVTWSVVDKASEPVPLPTLTRILAQQVPGLTASNWAGRGTFSALLRDLPLSPLRIDREANCLLDPRRIGTERATADRLPERSPSAQGERPASHGVERVPNAPDKAVAPTPHNPATQSAGALTAAPPAGIFQLAPAPSQAEFKQQVERVLSEEVAASARPIAVARLAHTVRQRCPGIEVDWAGCGTFKRLLEAVHPQGVQISWAQLGGYAFDPARHSLDFIQDNTQARGPQGEQDARWPKVAPMLQVASFPELDSAQYRAVLQALAQTLREGPFALAAATKRVRDLCVDQHVAVARADINTLLRALLFSGFDPAQADSSVDSLVVLACGVALAACRREGMAVDDEDRALLLSWMGAGD
ncbi:NYN domain-containing protein [Aquabacterium sp.]|uniref:NYN domain-containing protein n=1 Tax=Aquabacterium sp. TaxID=1872578 RepID=UPI0025C2A269|nr:NYN domain-containing protein [Aquabacterium sp.]